MIYIYITFFQQRCNQDWHQEGGTGGKNDDHDQDIESNIFHEKQQKQQDSTFQMGLARIKSLDFWKTQQSTMDSTTKTNYQSEGSQRISSKSIIKTTTTTTTTNFGFITTGSGWYEYG